MTLNYVFSALDNKIDNFPTLISSKSFVLSPQTNKNALPTPTKKGVHLEVKKQGFLRLHRKIWNIQVKIDQSM